MLSLFQVTLNLEQEALNQGAIPTTGDGLFGRFVGSLLSGIMAIGLIFVLIQLIQGAFDWISAGGEKGKIDTARQRITNGITGAILLASTVAIYLVLQTFLGVDVLNFGNGSASSGGSSTQAPGTIYCGGCLNKAMPATKSCNSWIDELCVQTGCAGQGTFKPANQNCCPGLKQYPNGRCDK